MLPICLELKNFLPYRTTDPLRFEGIHLACLTGPNGAGKSSLLDAMTWALWGKARARHDEDLVHQGQQDMYVQFDFEQEGIIYRVIRRRTRKQRGSGTLDLFVQDSDHKFNLISEPVMRATQERINQLLRLDYETFCNSAFLQQGKADAFTTRTPKERKQILSDILGLALWEQYETKVKEHLKRLEEQLTVYDLLITRINEELAREPALQAALAEAEQSREEAQAALEDAEKRLEEYEHVPHDLKHAQALLVQEQTNARQLEADMQAAETEITRHEERIATYESVIAAQAEIEAGYQTLQAARETNEALADKLRQLSDFGTRERELDNKLRDAREALEQQATQHRTRIIECERALEGDVSGELAAVQAEIEALRKLETERKDVQERMSALGEERAELEATNRSLRAEMFDLRERLDKLEKVETAVCPLCGQPLDEKHRRELVTQLTADGKTRGDTYRNHEGRAQTIGDEIAASKTRITDIDDELRRLQPLVERAGALQAQTDAAHDAETRLNEERAGLDAVQKLLDEGAYAQDIREQLAALAEERARIGYDEESHDAAREHLKTYREYEQRQTELQIALNSLPEAQSALEAAAARRTRTQQALDEKQGQMSGLETEIAQLTALLDEYRARQTEVSTLRTAANEAYQRFVNAQQELTALEAQRTRKSELQASAEEARYEQGLYNELRVAFGKNGIPAMIIETAIPELESAANDLLRRMTDGRMAVSFSTQREKKTGGVAETLDIQIADELGTRDYEMYSGGEAFRINFAIRVALSQMLARRAGAHLRTLFVDEGFGTQDSDGRDRLVEAITTIQHDFDMILVITHIDELRDHFPVHVVVEKMPGGSRVSVR